MSSSESSWKSRYYELEFTLEQILMGFEKVLADGGTDAPSAQAKGAFGIRKVTRSEFNEAEVLCCVADGLNMEYSFEFFKGKQQVLSTPFQQINIVPLASALSAGADRCLALVRNNDGDNLVVYSKEVTL